MNLFTVICSLSLLFLPVVAGPIGSFQTKCEDFRKGVQTFDTQRKAVVNIAEFLPVGTTIDRTAEGGNASCAAWVVPPVPVPVCRVNLRVQTSEESSVEIEVWLPEQWTGRILSIGNGGFGGCVPYADIEYGTYYGFATISTDNGHSGMSGGAFYRQPQVLEDFVWRAFYTGVVLGKDVVKQFYGQAHQKSYYLGCSTGGRQGWKAVQSYPDLFDGVVAGAPAIPYNGLIPWAAFALKTLGLNISNAALNLDDWKQVRSKVLEQCDGLDGATDGILEDSRQCKPDMKRWQCSSDSKGWCLTPAQLSAVEVLFKPLVVDNTVIHAGAAHGDEVRLIQGLYGPLYNDWIDEWFRYVVKEDLSWTKSQFSLQDALQSVRLNPFNIHTFDTDISAFRDRGGKVIHWHGQADEYLSITNSDQYYEAVSKTLKASPKELDKFYRYFRISGMGHCYGGPGTNILGQGYGMAVSNNPDDNILLRIVEWVEKGNAPEVLRATKLVNDDPRQGIAFSRKHCKHPKVNKYRGIGNGKDEAGWRCV
ncbi:Tannase/feruloyl esterase [Dendryphion nanum]|uniref:Carboxylic ester hydrolase n=1 Tax=Dendryphion nanum TaxID=256645 RepID=A0A9P9IIN7_9PLEO|nr:Tannase/feruloyl esterase [Dendryphion nanum]